MPMFEDHRQNLGFPDSQRAQTPPRASAGSTGSAAQLVHKGSEESIRTDLCEGPVPDSPPQQTARLPSRDATVSISDRAELVERLKRGESPTWVPNRHLEPLLHSPPTSTCSGRASRTSRPSSAGTPTAGLPADKQTPNRDSEAFQQLQDGLDIERPRSALHSGDFTHAEAASKEDGHPGREAAGTAAGRNNSRSSRGTQWMATSPPRHYHPFSLDMHSPPLSSLSELDVFRSGLSPVSSLSSSFVYKAPTSPLVQSESNTDEDGITALGSTALGSTTPNGPRLHSFSHYEIPRRHEAAAFPYQAHQPRKSLTSTPSMAPPLPQSLGLAHARRLSFAADMSPLQHASMVGSYEESILRGRMSTTPSKPLDFLAQIGVLGLGSACKPNLRCPPHVTLPFSAVFYSYATTPHGRSESEDGPSPYVGMVDLENGLPNQEAELRSKRKQLQSRTAARLQEIQRKAEAEVEGGAAGATAEDTVMQDAKAPRTAAAPPRQKRRPHTPRAPSGGSYRIPAQGQLQIIIKNQNKTAVKLFLIPYDVSDMEPETKTFIRQRCYSAGPIIDNVPALASLSLTERPILRYLVHLHICSPSRGRYYLYKSIRVVFANRVPDGKEKLRNELSFPEPRYSPYKPVRVMYGGGGGGGGLADKAFRRRSAGLALGSHSAGHTPVPLLPVPIPKPKAGQQQQPQQTCGSPSFSFASRMPAEPFLERSRAREPPNEASTPLTYNKLSWGDVGYGGNAFAPMVDGSPVAAEGLLSQRLRQLGEKQEE